MDRGPHVRVTAAGLLAALRGGGCVGLQRIWAPREVIWAPLERRDRKGLLTGRWELTPDEVKDLAAVCPQLQRVECAVGCPDRQAVAKASGLALPGPLTLILHGGQNPLSKDDVCHLLKQHNVAALELERVTLEEGGFWLGKALRENTTLTSLKLRGDCINTAGASALGEALRSNATLLSVDVSGMDDFDMVPLAEALRVNTALTSFRLSVSDKGIACAAALAEALHLNTTLRSLEFRCSGDSGGYGFVLDMVPLAEALRLNTTLTSVKLSANVGVAGAAALGEALRKGANLTSLNLRSSGVGCEGAVALAEGLRVNGTLTLLDLQCRGDRLQGVARGSEGAAGVVGDKGAAALAKALHANGSLTSLNLGGNGIGDEGAIALGQALCVNTTLTWLDLSENFIGPKGAAALAAALRINATLTALSLESNRIGATGAASLALALRLNTTLTSLNVCLNDMHGACTVFLGSAERKYDAAMDSEEADLSFEPSRGQVIISTTNPAESSEAMGELIHFAERRGAEDDIVYLARIMQQEADAAVALRLLGLDQCVLRADDKATMEVSVPMKGYTARVSLHVPAGAVSKPTRIRLLILPAVAQLETALALAGPVVLLLPHGLQLLKPATLTLTPFSPTEPDLIVVTNPGAGDGNAALANGWQLVDPADVEHVAETSAKRVSISHFSWWSLARGVAARMTVTYVPRLRFGAVAAMPSLSSVTLKAFLNTMQHPPPGADQRDAAIANLEPGQVAHELSNSFMLPRGAHVSAALHLVRTTEAGERIIATSDALLCTAPSVSAALRPPEPLGCASMTILPPWDSLPPAGVHAKLKLSLRCQLPSYVPMLTSTTESTLTELPIFLDPRAAVEAGAALQSARSLEAAPTATRTTPSTLFPDKPSDVFLSYVVRESGAEGDGYVFVLRQALLAAGFSVFLCEADILGGQRYLPFIGEAIRRCRCFVAVLSPSYGIEGVSSWSLLEAEMAGIRNVETRFPRIQTLRHSREPGTEDLPAGLEFLWKSKHVVPAGRRGTAADFVARGEGQLVMDELIAALRADGVLPSVALPMAADAEAVDLAPAGAAD